MWLNQRVRACVFFFEMACRGRRAWMPVLVGSGIRIGMSPSLFSSEGLWFVGWHPQCSAEQCFNILTISRNSKVNNLRSLNDNPMISNTQHIGFYQLLYYIFMCPASAKVLSLHRPLPQGAFLMAHVDTTNFFHQNQHLCS